MIIRVEKQLTFLVEVTNSLFSYGLPTASAKLSDLKPKANQEFEMNEDGPPTITVTTLNAPKAQPSTQKPDEPKFLDF